MVQHANVVAQIKRAVIPLDAYERLGKLTALARTDNGVGLRFVTVRAPAPSFLGSSYLGEAAFDQTLGQRAAIYPSSASTIGLLFAMSTLRT